MPFSKIGSRNGENPARTEVEKSIFRKYTWHGWIAGSLTVCLGATITWIFIHSVSQKADLVDDDRLDVAAHSRVQRTYERLRHYGTLMQSLPQQVWEGAFDSTFVEFQIRQMLLGGEMAAVVGLAKGKLHRLPQSNRDVSDNPDSLRGNVWEMMPDWKITRMAGESADTGIALKKSDHEENCWSFEDASMGRLGNLLDLKLTVSRPPGESPLFHLWILPPHVRAGLHTQVRDVLCLTLDADKFFDELFGGRLRGTDMAVYVGWEGIRRDQLRDEDRIHGKFIEGKEVGRRRILLDKPTHGAVLVFDVWSTPLFETRGFRQWIPDLAASGFSISLLAGVVMGLLVRSRAFYRYSAQIESQLKEQYAFNEQYQKRQQRNIHDGILPLLNGAKANLNWMLDRSAPVGLGVTDRAFEIRRLLSDIERELCLNMADGSPRLFDGKTFGFQMKAHVDMIRRAYDLHVDLEIDPELGKNLNGYFAAQLLEASRELLANARKHGRAREIRLKITRPTPSRVELCVQDNGIGFDPSTLSPGKRLGLRHMLLRAEELNGHFELESAPGQGTTVRFQAPCPGFEENGRSEFGQGSRT